MTDDPGEDDDWRTPVRAGLTAAAVAAVVIGLVAGVGLTVAARMSGLGSSGGGAEAAAGLSMPPYTKTPEAVESETLVEPPTPEESVTPVEPSDRATQVGEITLFANPTVVSAGERINLSGVYLDGEGVQLQVQRREGAAWMDFPTTAQVRNGRFATFVYTGRFGDNVFRVYDPSTGRSSNSVTVEVQ